MALQPGVQNPINGTNGNDVLIGTDADERLIGRGGDDSASGLGGDDSLDGGPGDDILYGGSGDDWLIGRRGSDQLHGGSGADSFRFYGDEYADGDVDTIADLNFADGDAIVLGHFSAGTFLGSDIPGELNYTPSLGLTGGGVDILGWAGLVQLVLSSPNVAAEQGVGDTLLLRLTNEGGAIVQTIAITGGWPIYSSYINQAPEPSNDSAAVNEDASVLGNVLANDADPDGDTLTVVAAKAAGGSDQAVPADGAAVVVGVYGTVTIAADGSYAYTAGSAAVQALAAGVTVQEVFTYTVVDPTGAAATATLVIDVTGVNDAAVIGGVTTGAVAEDAQQSATGTLTVDDVDTGQASFLAGFTAGAYGSLSLTADGVWTYQLDNTAAQSLKGGEVVNDTFTVKSADGTTKSVTIAVNGANDTASIAGVAAGTVVEDAQQTASGKLTIADADAGEAAFQAGTLAGSYGSLALAADGNWTYTLDNAAVQFLKSGETRVDTLIVKSVDGTAKSVAITIKGADEAAVIGGCDTGTVSEDCDFLAAGKLTITDADGPDCFDAGVYRGAYGYVLLASDGGWLYVLNPFDSGLDTLNDGQKTIDSVVIKAADGTIHAIDITVNGQNECPTLAKAFTGTGDLNDKDGFKTGAVGFSSLSSSALGNANAAYGTTGNDTFDAKGGNDTLYGWAGNDCLTGNTGHDTLYGGTGNDTLYGGADNDTLYGGSGADQLFGDAGNDILVGGFGADRLTGGGGADTFRFVSTRDTGDTITDFVRGTDKIDLSAFKVNGADHEFDAPVNEVRFSVGHDLVWYYDGANTIVLGNTDLDPNTAEFVLTLAGRIDLRASDFIL